MSDSREDSSLGINLDDLIEDASISLVFGRMTNADIGIKISYSHGQEEIALLETTLKASYVGGTSKKEVGHDRLWIDKEDTEEKDIYSVVQNYLGYIKRTLNYVGINCEFSQEPEKEPKRVNFSMPLSKVNLKQYNMEQFAQILGIEMKDIQGKPIIYEQKEQYDINDVARFLYKTENMDSKPAVRKLAFSKVLAYEKMIDGTD